MKLKDLRKRSNRLGCLLIIAITVATILVFYWRNDRLLYTFHTNEPVNRIVVSSNGLFIGAIDQSSTFYLWNTHTKDEIRLSFPNASLSALAFHPNNNEVAIIEAKGLVHVYNIQLHSLRSMQLTLLPRNTTVLNITYNPSGEYVAISGTERYILLAHSETGMEYRRFIHPLLNYSTDVRLISFSSDGKLLVSGSKTSDSTIALWDVSAGVLIGVSSCFCDIAGARFLQDNLLVVGNPHNSIPLKTEWKTSLTYNINFKEVETPSRLSSLAFRANGLQYAWGGTRLHDGYIFSGLPIIGEPDKNIYVASTSKPHTPLITLRGHRDITTEIAISSDGRQLISGSLDSTVRIWNIQN